MRWQPGGWWNEKVKVKTRALWEAAGLLNVYGWQAGARVQASGSDESARRPPGLLEPVKQRVSAGGLRGLGWRFNALGLIRGDWPAGVPGSRACDRRTAKSCARSQRDGHGPPSQPAIRQRPAVPAMFVSVPGAALRRVAPARRQARTRRPGQPGKPVPAHRHRPSRSAGVELANHATSIRFYDLCQSLHI